MSGGQSMSPDGRRLLELAREAFARPERFGPEIRKQPAAAREVGLLELYEINELGTDTLPDTIANLVEGEPDQAAAFFKICRILYGTAWAAERAGFGSMIAAILDELSENLRRRDTDRRKNGSPQP